MATIFCQNCNHLLPDGAIFCENCGAQIAHSIQIIGDRGTYQVLNQIHVGGHSDIFLAKWIEKIVRFVSRA